MILSILWFSSANAMNNWNSVYDYHNRIVYIRPNNATALIPLSFNEKFNSGQVIDSLLTGFPMESGIVAAQDKLYCFYNSNSYLAVKVLDQLQRKWHTINTLNDSIPFYAGATYFATLQNPSSIYTYGGQSPHNVSDRLLEFNLSSNTFQEIENSISPTAFYGSSSLLVDYDRQLFFGGRADSGWVSMQQMALWQGDSWSFKSISSAQEINSRVGALSLPLFQLETVELLDDFNQTFSLDGALMIGGDLLSSGSSPDFASLSFDSRWSWNSVEGDLSLQSVSGAATIYDTLVVVLNSTSPGYTLELYNATNLRKIDSVDYSMYGKRATYNRTLIITLSTVLPVVFAVIAIICGWRLYKHFSSEKPPLPNHLLDMLEVRREGEPKYDGEIKVNDYEDEDNLSINSWRKKRSLFEAEKKKSEVRTIKKDIKRSLSVIPESVSGLFRKGTGNDSKSTLNVTSDSDDAKSAQLNTPSMYSSSTYNDPPHLALASPERAFTPHISRRHRSVDEDFDVQVLVSSKRRSKLRVVNPDDEKEDERPVDQEPVFAEEEAEFIAKLFERMDRDKENE